MVPRCRAAAASAGRSINMKQPPHQFESAGRPGSGGNEVSARKPPGTERATAADMRAALASMFEPGAGLYLHVAVWLPGAQIFAPG